MAPARSSTPSVRVPAELREELKKQSYEYSAKLVELSETRKMSSYAISKAAGLSEPTIRKLLEGDGIASPYTIDRLKTYFSKLEHPPENGAGVVAAAPAQAPVESGPRQPRSRRVVREPRAKVVGRTARKTVERESRTPTSLNKLRNQLLAQRAKLDHRIGLITQLIDSFEKGGRV